MSPIMGEARRAREDEDSLKMQHPGPMSPTQNE
jgi:hypothetical protein